MKRGDNTMLNFLKECGIKEDTIKNMYNTYEESVLFNLSCNDEECIKIIKHMKQIGIIAIDEILEVYIDIFLNTYNNFIKKIPKHDISKFVEEVNNNIEIIEVLM